MDTTKCINNQNWEAYSQGKLSKTQLDLLNAHAQSCEICADIKEGIAAMQHHKNLVKHVASIDKKITRKTKKPYAKIIVISAFVAIAATLLIIGNAFLLMQAEDAEIHPILTEKITNANDSVQPEPKKILALEVPAKKPKVVKKTYTPPKEVSVETLASLADNTIPQTDAITSQTEDDFAPGAEELKALKRDITEDVKPTTESERTSDASKPQVQNKLKKQRVSGPQTTNNNVYYNKNTAIVLPTDSARIVVAKQLLARKEYQLGLNYLLGVRNDSTSAFYHEALYISAQFYIGLNQAHFAKGLLQEILKSENAFTLKAQTILGKLNEED